MSRSRILGMASSAGLYLYAVPAVAQLSGTGIPYTGGVLPSYGNNVNVETLRPQLERYFSTATLPSTAPAWVLNGSVGADLGLTDNALRTSAPRRADVFTNITPSISVIGDSARVKTNLVYNPVVQVYANQSSQTQISQFFSGQSIVTFIPDGLFLDLRGSTSQSSLLGSGFNNGSGSTYNRQNAYQTTSFSVTPYAEHRFGGWGTARLGYSFVRTLQDANDDNTVTVLNNQAGSNQAYGSIGNVTTQRERASFATGENFGRFNDLSVLEAIQYSGSGSYADSHRNQLFNELGFALNHKVTLLGGIGYQDILYSGSNQGILQQNSVKVNEPTWNTGVRYTPNPDSTLTVLYGRRDGSTSVSFDGQFAPTARTRLIGRYSTGITSDIEDAQNLLATTTVGPGGLVTDTTTGAPVNGGGSSFGVQNGVYRVKRLSLTGLFLAARDSYSVTLGQEDRTTLTTSTSAFTGTVIPSGTSSSSFFTSASWQHELTPVTTGSVSLQYATSNNTSQLLGGGLNNNGRQDTFSTVLTVSRQFTETLSGNVRYIFTDQFGGRGVNVSRFNTGNYTENLLLVGLRRSF